MRGLSIRSKVIAVVLAVGLASLGVGGLIGYRTGNAALVRAVEQRLTAQRETKRARIEVYIQNQLRFTAAVGGAPEMVTATRAFIGAIRTMRAAPVDPKTDQANAAVLTAWYRTQFVPRLDRVTEGRQPAEALIPADAVARQLQADYIARNTNPIGEKYKLLQAPGGSPYDEAHGRYHPTLQRLGATVGFFDVNIMDAETGDVVYGGAKEPDFASNMFTGPFSQSGFAQVARRALDPVNGGAAVIGDYTRYEPSAFAPELLAAVPIEDGGHTIGVFVAQIDIRTLNSFLTDDGRWRQTGQGETGEVVLVGEDRLYRSEPRLLLEHPDRFFAAMLAGGLPKATVDKMQALDTAILTLPSKLDAIEAAFRNQSGVARYSGVDGTPVIAAYGPVEVAGLRWAVTAKQDEAEAFAPAVTLRTALLTAAAIATIVLTFVALVCASAVTRPVRRLLAAMASLRAGGAATRVPVQGHDEFAELARAYNEMADAIDEREQRLRAADDERAATLRRLYPEAIAERLRAGATVSAETVANVTAAVAWIIGLDGDDAAGRDATVIRERLNTMLEMLNAAAAQHGLEPVRALGESYIAVCGLSSPHLDHADRALAWTETAMRALARLADPWAQGVSLRFGLASGDIDVVLLTSSHSPYDVWGKTVSTARLLAVETSPATVRVAETTYRLLSDLDGFAAFPDGAEGRAGGVSSWVRAAGPAALAQAAE